MLLERSRNTLDELAETLKTQRYYLKIKGVATRQGNLELNKKLATERAQAAADYLGKQGIETQRMSTGAPELGDVPSVTFTLGQQSY